MSFLKYMASPMAIALVLLVLAMIVDWRRRRVRPNLFLVLAALGLSAFVFMPVGPFLAKPLEDRYRRTSLPSHIDGIVVLNGGLEPLVVQSRQAPAQSVTAQRLAAGAEMARRFPQARVIFSGASSEGGNGTEMEIAATVALAEELGIEKDRLILESKSTNTWSNLVESMHLAAPRSGQTWVLVTSATHLPRSMAIAGKLGWKMTPWPSEYLTGENVKWLDMQRSPSTNVLITERAVHEWVGLVAYRLMGRL